ncbi:hypothetical protein EfmAA290_32000 (plasmid) [Enterococcus faecium]|nr:hypothetical protein EfmAA290_32000 [Enterococcus faecium]
MKEKILDGLPGVYKNAKNAHLETTNWDWAIDPTGLGALFLEQNTGVVVCSAVEGIC